MNRSTSWALALAISGFPARAAADINVESRRDAYERQGFRAQVDLDFGFRQGNVNSLELGLKTELSFRRDRHLGFVFHESSYAARSLARDGRGVSDLGGREQRFRNYHMGHVRYAFRVLRWLHLEALTQLEMNEFLLVRTRFLLGGLPRFTLYQNERFSVAVGSGYLAEFEDLDRRTYVRQPTSDSPRNWWHRWGNVATVAFQITERFSARDTVYVQPRFDDPADLRIFNQAELQIAITKHFSFKLRTTLQHDSKPPFYCGVALEEGGTCADADVLRLVATDVSIENAFSVQF